MSKMKKLFKPVTLLLGIVSIALLAGCATPIPYGFFRSDMTIPMTATSNAKGTKVGTSQLKTYCTFYATGDASVDAACKDGDIKEIKSVDWTVDSWLGIISTYTTTVTGE
jgi:hypothetical protein